MRVFVTTGIADASRRIGPSDRSLSREVVTAVPPWAQALVGAETWQGRRLELSNLLQLADLLPQNLKIQGDTILWRGADEQELAVDFTPMLIVLAAGLTELRGGDAIELGSD